MRRELTIALMALLPVLFSAAQQANPQSTVIPDSYLPDAAPFSYKTAFYAGSGIIAPELLALNVTGLASGHCKKVDGTAKISMIVSEDGTPEEIYLLRATGNDLDKLALKIAKDDRFNPGALNGRPAPTVVSDEITLHTCIRETSNDQGQKVAAIILKSTPEQKVELRQEPAPATTHLVDDLTEKQTSEGPPV